MSALFLALTLAAGPSFTAHMLDGSTLRAKDVDDKVVVLAFWATWCAPCLAELPHLDALARSHKDLVVIAAATDGPETRARVKGVVAQHKWTLPVAIDADGSLRARFSSRAENPFLVVLDRNGDVAYSHAGYAAGDEQKLTQVVEDLLK